MFANLFWKIAPVYQLILLQAKGKSCLCHHLLNTPVGLTCELVATAKVSDAELNVEYDFQVHYLKLHFAEVLYIYNFHIFSVRAQR